jgi:hypothetical protein
LALDNYRLQLMPKLPSSFHTKFYSLSDCTPRSIAVCDIDGIGHLDVAVAVSCLNQNRRYDIVSLISDKKHEVIIFFNQTD